MENEASVKEIEYLLDKHIIPMLKTLDNIDNILIKIEDKLSSTTNIVDQVSKNLF